MLLLGAPLSVCHVLVPREVVGNMGITVGMRRLSKILNLAIHRQLIHFICSLQLFEKIPNDGFFKSALSKTLSTYRNDASE